MIVGARSRTPAPCCRQTRPLITAAPPRPTAATRGPYDESMIVAFLVAATAASPLPESGLAAADLERLARGETVARLEAVAGSAVREGLGMRVLAAAPERVFRAVIDVGHYREFMPFMSASDAAAEPDGTVLSRQTLDLPGRPRTYTVRARHRVEETPAGPAWTASWTLVPGSGDLRENRGTWTLTAFAGGGTLVVLRLLSDTGERPAWLQDRLTLKSLAWILDGLRQHVGRCRYDDPEPPGCDGG